MGRLNVSPWGVLSLSPPLRSWVVFSPQEPYRDGVQEAARVQNDTFVCITGTCGDVYCHFFTNWPNYPRQFPVMQRYLIWKVYKMFHEMIISGFFFLYHPTHDPSLDPGHAKTMFQSWICHVGSRKSGSFVNLTRIFGISEGPPMKSCCSPQWGKSIRVDNGNVKRVMEFALRGFFSPLN